MVIAVVDNDEASSAISKTGIRKKDTGNSPIKK
jgi:hypothetical protein